MKKTLLFVCWLIIPNVILHAQILIKNSSQNEIVRITETGNMGVGVSNPQGRLEIKGSTNLPAPNSGQIVMQNASGIVTTSLSSGLHPGNQVGSMGYMAFHSHQTTPLDLWSEIMRYTLNGVGIGNTNPSALLEIGSSSGIDPNRTVQGAAVQTTAVDLPSLKIHNIAQDDALYYVLGVDGNDEVKKRSVASFPGGGGGVGGSGIATRVAFWAGSPGVGTSTLTHSANLFWNNTNSFLGIGVTNPQARLHTNSTVRFEALAGVGVTNPTPNANKVVFANTNGDLLALGLGSTNQFLRGDGLWALPPSGETIWQRSAAGDISPKTVTDYVGIGTTNPEVQLEVYNPTSHAQMFIKSQGSYAAIYINNTPSNNAYGAYIGQKGTDHALRFAMNGSNLDNPDMILSDGGYVGIGLSNPQVRFHTTGGVRFQALAGVGVTNPTANANKVVFADVDGDLLALGLGSTNQFLRGDGLWALPPSGETIWQRSAAGDISPKTVTDYVGIGTTNPEVQLEVYNPTSHAQMFIKSQGSYAAIYINNTPSNNAYGAYIGQKGTDHALRFAMNGSNLDNPDMILSDGGYVGIGLSNPQVRFHTTGGVRFQALAGVGVTNPTANANKVVFADVDGDLLALGLGNTNQFLRGDGTWQQVLGDNLGNHLATQFLRMNGQWITNNDTAVQSETEGIYIKDEIPTNDYQGGVGIGCSPIARLTVGGQWILHNDAPSNPTYHGIVANAQISSSNTSYTYPNESAISINGGINPIEADGVATVETRSGTLGSLVHWNDYTLSLGILGHQHYKNDANDWGFLAGIYGSVGMRTDWTYNPRMQNDRVSTYAGYFWNNNPSDNGEHNFTVFAAGQSKNYFGGRVGIRTTTPPTALAVLGLTSPAPSGTFPLVYNPTDGGFYYSSVSSMTIKEDIRPLDVDLERVLQIDPKTYKYKENGVESVGLIAEDLDLLGFKELVIYQNGRPEGVQYDKVSLYLLNVIKDMNKRIKILENRNN